MRAECGGGFTISNITININAGPGTAYAGLFAVLEDHAEIRNLNIFNVLIWVAAESDVYAGALAGMVVTAVTLENIQITNTAITAESAQGNIFAGGLFGGSDFAANLLGGDAGNNIDNCTITNISVTAEAALNVFSGGICGFGNIMNLKRNKVNNPVNLTGDFGKTGWLVGELHCFRNNPTFINDNTRNGDSSEPGAFGTIVTLM